jgi:hypothetical protein
VGRTDCINNRHIIEPTPVIFLVENKSNIDFRIQNLEVSINKFNQSLAFFVRTFRIQDAFRTNGISIGFALQKQDQGALLDSFKTMVATAASIPTESNALLPSSSNGSGSGIRGRPTWILWSIKIVLVLVLVAVIAICILVDDVDDDELASDSASAYTRSDRNTLHPSKDNSRRYTATQFISFTINTLGGLDSHGECAHQPVDPETGVCYLGNKKNLTADVHHRMQIVEEVLERLKADAYKEDPDIDSSPSVLKIFMMPEFFWRGPNGAYSTKELFDSDEDANDGILIQVADRGRDLVAVPEFEDYLFVFGTVIAAESPNDPYVYSTSVSTLTQLLNACTDYAHILISVIHAPYPHSPLYAPPSLSIHFCTCL